MSFKLLHWAVFLIFIAVAAALILGILYVLFVVDFYALLVVLFAGFFIALILFLSLYGPPWDPHNY